MSMFRAPLNATVPPLWSVMLMAFDDPVHRTPGSPYAL
jgi:hypothetical protein